MTEMEMTGVKSSTIAALGYDAGASVRRVQFIVGGAYDYFDVPKAVYDAFLSASSLGKYLHGKSNRATP